MKMKILINLIIILASQIAFADTLDEVHQYIQNRLHPEQVQTVQHCCFQAQFQLHQNFNELNPEMQSLAKTLLMEPFREHTLVSPSGHFTLHYNTEGSNVVPLDDISGNGIPDYIDSAAVIFDNVWDVEIDQLGFKAPPDSTGNEATNYHIYFTALSYYGGTWPIYDQELSGQRFPSYIQIHSNFFGSGFYTNGLEALKVTAAHEFNHAIQLGYRFRSEDIYFLEMTSTWLEDFVYDEVNDYLQYLPDFMNNLNIYSKKFTRSDGWTEYANSIYLHMLEKEYGAEAVVDIWERIKSEYALVALDDYLVSKSSSFALSQNLYASWLYFTGDRTQGSIYFPEAAHYPMLTPFSERTAIEQDLDPLKMRLVYIDADSGYTYLAKIQADTNNGVFNHIGYDAPFLGPHPFGTSQVFEQTGNRSRVVVVTNPTSDRIENLSYSIEFNPESAKKEPIYVHVKFNSAVFRSLPSRSTITIFTINGLHIRTIHPGLNNYYETEWDLTDRFGNKVASGVYLYYVTGNGSSEIGKFAIVR